MIEKCIICEDTGIIHDKGHILDGEPCPKCKNGAKNKTTPRKMKKQYYVEMVGYPVEPLVKLVSCSQCSVKVNSGYNLFEKKKGSKSIFMCDECYKGIENV